MRKVVSVSALALCLLTNVAAAQTSPPPTDLPSPAVRPPATKNAAREACRSEVDGKRLTGAERKAEMRSCMSARSQACRRTADDQHIPKRAGERRDFVKRCLQQGA